MDKQPLIKIMIIYNNDIKKHDYIESILFFVYFNLVIFIIKNSGTKGYKKPFGNAVETAFSKNLIFFFTKI
jgi:phosphate starvation-inducible membrane PsiE